MDKLKSSIPNNEWRLKAFLVKNRKNTVFTVSFRIPVNLSSVLERKDMTTDQKILLVKSWTDKVKNEDGSEQERIPDQHAVILIMALELGAL